MRLDYYSEMLGCIRTWRTIPKIWNYIRYRCHRRQPRVSLGAYTPQIAGLLLTKRCNLDCGYCSVAKAMSQDPEQGSASDFDLEKIQRIFCHPLFHDCIFVDLLGGEPLLVKDLDRIIAYLNVRGYMTNTSTNGLLLGERVRELKQAGISRINVSLYDANRAFLERNLENINRIFPVHASVVLTRSDVEHRAEKVFDIIRFAHRNRCRSLRFWIYRCVGLDPHPSEVICDDHQGYRDFRQRADRAFPGFCLWPYTVQSGATQKRCPQPWQRIFCDGEGRLGICCGTDKLLEGAHSILWDGEPEQVWNHAILVDLRAQLLDPQQRTPEICRLCNLLADPGW